MSTLGLYLAASLVVLSLLAYFALAGGSPAKAGQRRLQALRLRHSENAMVRVEGQLRKAIAARRPQMQRVAGSSSRIEALALRLERSGTGWSPVTYLCISLGLGLLIALVTYLQSGVALLSLGLGTAIGAGVPAVGIT